MHTYIHMSLQEICLSLWCFCQKGFVRGGVCPSPLLSEYIRYNIKLNITFNFRFYMYEIFLKCDVTCLSQTVAPSRTPPPQAWHTFWTAPLPFSFWTYVKHLFLLQPRLCYGTIQIVLLLLIIIININVTCCGLSACLINEDIYIIMIWLHQDINN